MLYILIWLIVLVLSAVFFYKAAGSLSLFTPNLISISFYYSFLITSFIGSLLIVLGIDHFYMMNKLDHQEYRLIGFIVVCFAMVFFPLTMFLVSKLAGFDAPKEFKTYLEKPIESAFNRKTEFYFLFAALSLISILAVMYTMLKTNQVPLFSLLKGAGGEELAKLRIDAGRNFSGNVLIRNIFAVALTPLLSIIAYVYSVKTRELKWRLLFLALFFSAILINVYDLAKSPVLFYLIMFILVRIYIGKTKFNAAKFIFVGSTGVLLLLFMYVFIFGQSNISSYLSYSTGPIGRIILSQIAPMFLHLDFFGNSVPFLNGASLPSSIIGLFDMNQVRSARVVMELAYPENVAAGIAGVLNTLYVAEAYANFGYIGIVAGTIYIAALVQVLYICFIRLPKNPVFLSLFIYFTINIPRTLVGGFTDFLFNPIWFLLTFLFVGILLFIRVRIDLTAYFKRLREN